MMKEWRVLATAIMFLTRIPVGQSGSGDPRDLAASTQYFPVVGLLIGSLLSIVFVVANHFWNSEIAVVLTLLSAMLLTGGFHEDGVADVADSAGAWTREKKLEVMRDSRVGTYGSLALTSLLLLKFVCLSSIASLAYSTTPGVDTAPSSFSVWVIVATLILAHVLGRWSTLPLVRSTPYVRERSNNKVFVEAVVFRHLVVGSLIALAIVMTCWTVLGHLVLYVVCCVCVTIALARYWFIHSIGGITGDCLGAANQLVEVVVYLCLTGLLIR